MEDGSENCLLNLPRSGVTEAAGDGSDTSEESPGDVEKSSGLSYTAQMNNRAASRNPSALKRATVRGASRRGQAESRVVFSY